MELEIKQIIEADLNAQARLKDAQLKLEEALHETQREKLNIQSEVWGQAKQDLELEKERLNTKLETTIHQAEEDYRKAVHKLEAHFNQNKAQWMEDILNKCIEGNQ